MTTLQLTDGKLLRAQRPAGIGQQQTTGFFPPLWTNGELADGTFLKSFNAIYRSQPIIAAVVDKLSRRIATLPLVAYETDAKGARQPSVGDSLDSVIKHPMPRRSTVHLTASIAQSLLIQGNALVAKVHSLDQELPPDMLWPLDWAQVSAYGPVGGQIEWWSTSQFDGVERFIKAEDTIHFAWPGPDGGEIGVSPLEKLGVTIRLEDAAQRHQTSLLGNGAHPSVSVSLEGDPSKEKLDYARARVEAASKGVDKAGSWLFMGANVKLQPLSLSPVEVALIDQRKLDREEIGAVYDLAGPLMNDLEHGTFSNVSELLRSLYRDVIPPWTELIVQTMQAQLIDTEPAWLHKFVRFDFSDKLKGDPLEQSVVDRSDVEAGIRTRDEARDGRGLLPKGGPAGELTMAVNNQGPLDAGTTTDVPADA